MEYFARSATSNSAPQTYFDHNANVSKNACGYVKDALRYWRGAACAETLLGIACNASVFHDLGKLDEGNQCVLAGAHPCAKLPIPHQDAGVAYLLEQGEEFPALLIYAHHIGLPDYSKLGVQDFPMRIEDGGKRQRVDSTLHELLKHHEEAGSSKYTPSQPLSHPMSALDFRILFSCLTDADHGDATRATGEITKNIEYPKLQPEARLKLLARYVAQQAEKNKSDIPDKQRRNAIRDSFFNACTQSDTEQSLTLCDAPVGTGKTTSVMAHLLRVTSKQKLRRIFVILPFTNIIRQSVDVYRHALVLPGEEAHHVVAEIHHRADFKDKESRRLTALWNSPIVVTTAVAFFETLASNWPATVRRLHNLPGSAVFLDEAHAALPVKLLPLAWHWMKHTARNWSCHWTLASGSLQRFWEIKEFEDVLPKLLSPTNIVTEEVRAIMFTAETTRVTYRYRHEPMALAEMMTWLNGLEGPVLVVLNTVHTAAAAAKMAAKRFGESAVEHLSNSLCAADRDKTLARVRKRLADKSGCTKWFLFATSCVEAGVDISFRTGVRECASLTALLQLAGRINRNGEFADSDVWTINLCKTDDHVVENPAWSVSTGILQRFFENEVCITPELCTKALTQELRERGICEELKKLQKAEDIWSFETIEKRFCVIESDTVPVVVDKNLISRIENFEEISWCDIQKGSVQIRKPICDKFDIHEARRYPGLYLWKHEYTPFLGYMEGVLKLTAIDKAKCAIL